MKEKDFKGSAIRKSERAKAGKRKQQRPGQEAPFLKKPKNQRPERPALAVLCVEAVTNHLFNDPMLAFELETGDARRVNDNTQIAYRLHEKCVQGFEQFVISPRHADRVLGVQAVLMNRSVGNGLFYRVTNLGMAPAEEHAVSPEMRQLLTRQYRISNPESVRSLVCLTPDSNKMVIEVDVRNNQLRACELELGYYPAYGTVRLKTHRSSMHLALTESETEELIAKLISP